MVRLARTAWSDQSGLWGLHRVLRFYFECDQKPMMGFKQGGECLDPDSIFKSFSRCLVVDGLRRVELGEVSDHLGGQYRSPGELGFER